MIRFWMRAMAVILAGSLAVQTTYGIRYRDRDRVRESGVVVPHPDMRSPIPTLVWGSQALALHPIAKTRPGVATDPAITIARQTPLQSRYIRIRERILERLITAGAEPRAAIFQLNQLFPRIFVGQYPARPDRWRLPVPSDFAGALQGSSEIWLKGDVVDGHFIVQAFVNPHSSSKSIWIRSYATKTHSSNLIIIPPSVVERTAHFYNAACWFIGVGDHFEIWPDSDWQEFRRNASANSLLLSSSLEERIGSAKIRSRFDIKSFPSRGIAHLGLEDPEQPLILQADRPKQCIRIMPFTVWLEQIRHREPSSPVPASDSQRLIYSNVYLSHFTREGNKIVIPTGIRDFVPVEPGDVVDILKSGFRQLTIEVVSRAQSPRLKSAWRGLQERFQKDVNLEAAGPAAAKPLAIAPHTWWGRLYLALLQGSEALVAWNENPDNAYGREYLQTWRRWLWVNVEKALEDASLLGELKDILKNEEIPKFEEQAYYGNAILSIRRALSAGVRLGKEQLKDMLWPAIQEDVLSHDSFFVEGEARMFHKNELPSIHRELIYQIEHSGNRLIDKIAAELKGAYRDWSVDYAVSLHTSRHQRFNARRQKGQALMIGGGPDKANGQSPAGPADEQLGTGRREGGAA